MGHADQHQEAGADLPDRLTFDTDASSRDPLHDRPHAGHSSTPVHSGPVLHVRGLDHIVLVVTDVERSVEWYRDTLGLEALRFDEWRAGAAPFPSVRVDEGTIIDILAGDRSGTNVDHLCLVLDPTDLHALAAGGRFEVIEGPVSRWG